MEAVSVAAESSHESPLRKILIVASIGIGIQFVWALQMSLLTPYVELLGIPHKWASLVWLCSPICGLLVQPMVGYYSDNSASRFGRRRPYIAAGTALVAVAVFLISFAADIGHTTGDSLANSAKPRATVVFIFGFFVLDVSNTMIQGPCRAFLGDLSGTNSSTIRTANVSYVFFLSVGCVLGFAASSYNKLHNMFPFTMTTACDIDCANLKSCFFLSIIILIILTTLALTFVKEDNQSIDANNLETATKVPFLGGILSATKNLPKSMWYLMLVTFLLNFAWSPFLMFNTDWMGRDVYGGKVGENLYAEGAHVGSVGLMIQAAMVGVTSLGIEFLGRGLRGGINKMWVVSNMFLAVCMCLVVVITKLAESSRQYSTSSDGKIITLPPQAGIKAGALALLTIMGFPLGVSQCVPPALAIIYSSKSGAGLGLSLGIISIAYSISTMMISVVVGPWDALFGGSNLPAFVVGAFAAVASAIVTLVALPSPDTSLDKTSTTSDVAPH